MEYVRSPTESTRLAEENLGGPLSSGQPGQDTAV